MRKLISTLVTPIILLSILFAPVALPLPAEADTVLNWSNPEAGPNPFKLGPNSITPQLLTAAVSCTGLQNTIAIQLLKLNDTIQKELKKESEKLKKLITDTYKKKIKRKITEKKDAKVRKIVLNGLSAASTAAGSTFVGTGVAVALNGQIDVEKDTPPPITTKSDGNTPEQQDKIDEQKKLDVAKENRLEKEKKTVTCLNGIAIRLARNQLSSMTQYTMNWINSGFNGNPMFVRNINSYVDSINRELIDRENRIFKDPANSYDYPYGRDYARAQSDSYRASQNVYGSLKQDLTSYLEPGTSPQDFATDFSKGGWDGWLALTQHPQNNPLGFTLAATENAAKKKENEIANAKAEIDRNGGYLDQKKCAEYEKPKTAHSDKEYNLYCTGGPITGRPSWCASEGDIRSGKDVKGQKCLVYETVTPGSTNKTKIDTYVNTPERQLELVRTMDDALNTLFASLLNKFRSQGLSSLGSGGTMFNNASDGFGSNSILDTNGNVIPVNNGGNTVGGGSGTDGSFDITKDLGNTYIKAVDDGAWDARTNTPELLPGQGTKGHFYTVSTGGNTQISPNVNYWARGDKVFYDGTMWKKGVPRYIIDKKGALQIENDYGEVTDDSTAVLSLVMPSLGKLDYCIPGPNPNWRNNIQDALASYIDSVNDTTTPPIDPNTLEQTLQDYAGKVNNRYGPNSPMQGGSGSSNAQLKMSPTGLAITKDMVAYADTISTAQDEASASKVQTEANMKNLIQLKNKVNAIIGAAQRRRDAKRIQQGKQRVPDLCIETEKVTYVSNGVLR